MDVLPYNFRTLQLSGMWFESSRFLALKMLYRVALMAVIFEFTAGEMVQLTRASSNLDEFADVLFVCFTFVSLCVKMTNFVSRRSDMDRLLGNFRADLCKPRSPEEAEILRRCSRTAGRIFLGIMSGFQSTGWMMLLSPLLIGGESPLPFTSYQPYDASHGLAYAITYVLQFIAGSFGILIDVTMDTMVYGFIIMSTAQFEIICHRLTNSTAGIGDCIEHHVLIQDTVEKIQNFFIPMIVPLFCFSLVTLSTSIVQMSQKQIASVEFWSMALYLACMLCQVFLYCWFGNELELKSEAVIEAIYSSKWVDFAAPERKSLWFIMLRTQRLTNISFHGQCALSLNTFIWVWIPKYFLCSIIKENFGSNWPNISSIAKHSVIILVTCLTLLILTVRSLTQNETGVIVKTSYAAFNLLQQASI